MVAEDRLPPELKPIPEITRRFNQPELKHMRRRRSSSSGSSSNIGENSRDSGKQKAACAESMEEGRASDAATRLPASLDNLHCLTPTGVQ